MIDNRLYPAIEDRMDWTARRQQVLSNQYRQHRYAGISLEGRLVFRSAFEDNDQSDTGAWPMSDFTIYSNIQKAIPQPSTARQPVGRLQAVRLETLLRTLSNRSMAWKSTRKRRWINSSPKTRIFTR